MQNGYILILAIGMLPVILTGDIDLSVGSIVALIGAVISKLLVGHPEFPVFAAILLGLAAGMVIGAWHGFWIAYMRIPAFIATLSGMLIFRGVTLVITQGKTIAPFPDSYQYLAQAYIPDIPGTEGFHGTTVLIGVLLIIAYVISEIRRRKREMQYGFLVSRGPLFGIRLAAVTVVIAVATFWFTRFQIGRAHV